MDENTPKKITIYLYDKGGVNYDICQPMLIQEIIYALEAMKFKMLIRWEKDNPTITYIPTKV